MRESISTSLSQSFNCRFFMSGACLQYHDMMYAGDGRINPYGNALETAEIQYQVRRLSHHPSIAIWDSCNECGGGGECVAVVLCRTFVCCCFDWLSVDVSQPGSVRFDAG